MQKDLVFFKKEGEEGVALTSTSANHIANMAKELREKADKGEATARDAMAALMLAAIMKKESEED